ncbi:hypothetical protein, partial [Prauserella flavalba]|uniref:hypothetical protein n=1 Tax=Prauserella flavalba TaxID=1477506 RepID=UPI00143CFD5E
ASLAVADRLGQVVDKLDELGQLFAAKVADIDSEPYPDVQQPAPGRTWGPGDDEPPAQVHVLYDPDSKTNHAWLYRTVTGWAWGEDSGPLGQAGPWASMVLAADAPLRDVTTRFLSPEAARGATS